jgi:hypothetical protein
VIGQAIAREAPAIDGFLRAAQATLVPEAEARRLGLLEPGESYDPVVPDADEMRAHCLVALKELGALQNGQAVPLEWCYEAARAIALAATGECDFDLGGCDNARVLKLIHDAVLKIVVDERRAARGGADDDDIPF